MEDNLRLKSTSGNHQTVGSSKKIVTAVSNHSLNLGGRFKPELPNLCYRDFHHDISINIKDFSPKPSGNHHKEHRKTTKEEELVKYMSNLPSYLERGRNCQEKVFNFGVLDWGRLEKWHCSHKQMPQITNRHSLSSSNSSSSFSIDGSFVYSGRGQSCSSTHQRICRPSLQFHLMSSLTEDASKEVKSLEKSTGKFEDVITRSDQPFCSSHSEVKLDQRGRNDLDMKLNLESGSLTSVLNYEVPQCMKVKRKAQEGKLLKTAGQFKEEKNIVDQDVSGNSGTRDLPQDTHSEWPHLSESTTLFSQNEAEGSERSFPELPQEIDTAAFHSDVPHSCPLPSKIDGCSKIKSYSAEAESVSYLPDSSQSVPPPAKVRINPSRIRTSEVKKPIMMPVKSTMKEHSVEPLKEPAVGPDVKSSKLPSEKVRSTSPFRRLSIGMGKISKTFSSKEVSSLPELSSTSNPLKSHLENPMASFSQDTSSADIHSSASRARSSPLRRLLEPLLKPKASNCHHSGKPLNGDLMLTDRACKSSDGKLDSSTGTRQPGRVRLDSSNDSLEDQKQGSSSFRALLRVAVKNGQPLFRFAVDNDSDILAAKMKKLSASKADDYSCIYTFFSIQEAKKKNKWINQGSKGKVHDFIPNVVAQLKVSGSQFSNFSRQNHIEWSFAGEFLLFAVDLQQEERQTSDFQPNDELAAIIVKIAKVINRSTVMDGRQTEKSDIFSEVRSNSTCGENVKSQSIVGSQTLISLTAILPSGIHSLPSKGGPSSLIQRWRSGGSCDCGGWDLGCKLRVLANQNQFSKKFGASKACSGVDKFELFSQGGEEDNKPVFCLDRFQDGIFSVEYNSSLSVLQAFSLCIAVLDSKRLCEMPESGSLFEEKTSLETMLAQNDVVRVPNVVDGEVPARYVSYPPLSPVGRV